MRGEQPKLQNLASIPTPASDTDASVSKDNLVKRGLQCRSKTQSPRTADLGNRFHVTLELSVGSPGRPCEDCAHSNLEVLVEDRIFGHAAELGFYFLFALFPTLLGASSILGLAARSASQIYIKLLDYLALVIPTAALGTVLHTFNETTAASTSGKVTFGLIAAIWSASVGISALQDTLLSLIHIS